MTERSTQHGGFTIERVYAAAPARVFQAWADPKAKARWFAGPEEWTETVREFDFRVGGRERLSGTWTGGRVSTFDCHYHDIVPERRIVYAYAMEIDGKRISVSLATVTLEAAGAAGTRLVFTEQAVFLDGYDDADSRERGTGALLDKLGAALG
jgi:uncharacterized protein YndB with AHSA1/START domain